MKYRVAVLTVSDRCSRGEAEDRSGPAVAGQLRDKGFEVAETGVIPDERERISTQLREWADSDRFDAIFTTGGTGVAPRDVTPEATRAVIDREVPGIGEKMRLEGAKSTPLAALSRSMAGSRGTVLIVNLPGSPKGAVESLDAIVELVPHVLHLLKGDTAHEDAPPPLR